MNAAAASSPTRKTPSAGKLVLVTGASSGIGRSSAELFALRGARVLLVARNAGKLREIADHLEEKGASAACYGVDLAKADEVTAMAERIKSEHGVPDIIVNNAGSGRWLSTAETSLEEARQMIELPYLAAFYVTRMFLPEMIARGHGHSPADLPSLPYRLAECVRLWRRAPCAEGLHRGASR
jgi:short-subunit dehydrogenase